MDTSSGTRQQKFREKMQSKGRKQRTFFLSDSAMDAIKIRKEITQAPSLSHVLESWFVSQDSSTPPGQKYERQLSDGQLKILDAAGRFAKINRELKSTPRDAPGRTQIVEKFMAAADELTKLI